MNSTPQEHKRLDDKGAMEWGPTALRQPCIAPAKLPRVAAGAGTGVINALCDNPTTPGSYYSLHGFTVGI
jgi:hypothetical protein